MIILSTLLKFNIAAQVALNPDPIEGYYTGIAYAVFMYMNIQKLTLLLPIYPSIGVVATAPTPVPGVAFSNIDVKIPDKDDLKDALVNAVKSSMPIPMSPEIHAKLFIEIGKWLNAPMDVKIKSSIAPATLTGSGVALFPVMPALGIPCWATFFALAAAGYMQGPDDYYEMLSNYIFMGLIGNFIPPIVSTGTAIPTTGVFTGMTFPFWIFVDILNWPRGGNSIPADMLDSLGLTGIIDANGEANTANLQALSDDIDTAGQPTVTPTDCQPLFNGNEFYMNTACVNTSAISILNNGAMEGIDLSLIDVVSAAAMPDTPENLLTSASISNMNSNFTSISSTFEPNIDTLSADFYSNMSSSAVPMSGITPEHNSPLDSFGASAMMTCATSINICTSASGINAIYVSIPVLGTERDIVFERF